MAWIEQIEEADAQGELRDLYRDITSKRGKLANILKVHSLNPGALQTHLDLYMHLLFGRSGLSRGDREAIAVVTSANNSCAYCVNHHFESLARYEKDPETLRVIREETEFEALDPRRARMLRHVARLTLDPSSISEQDLQSLREVGFSDCDILDITLVNAYFNFVNRIALGLGVAYSPEEMSGYK